MCIETNRGRLCWCLYVDNRKKLLAVIFLNLEREHIWGLQCLEKRPEASPRGPSSFPDHSSPAKTWGSANAESFTAGALSVRDSLLTDYLASIDKQLGHEHPCCCKSHHTKVIFVLRNNGKQIAYKPSWRTQSRRNCAKRMSTSGNARRRQLNWRPSSQL